MYAIRSYYGKQPEPAAGGTGRDPQCRQRQGAEVAQERLVQSKRDAEGKTDRGQDDPVA